MTEEQIDRIATALEQIAKHLEQQNEKLEDLREGMRIQTGVIEDIGGFITK